MLFIASILSPSAAAALLLLSTSAYVIYQCFLSPLAKIPGPFWAKLTNWYQVYVTVHKASHRKNVSLHKKSVVDQKAFREIYKAGAGFNKAASYDVLRGSRSFDLVGHRDEKIHSEQRKLVARAYSMNSMVHLEPNVDAVIKTLIQKLDGLSGVVDLGAFIQLFAFDVIGAVSFSRPFGYLLAGDDHGVFARIRTALGSLSWLGHVGWFFNLHQTLRPVIGNWLAANDRNGFFHQFARQEVIARKDRGGDDRDIINQLFTVQKTKPHLSDTDISFAMASNVFAGSDTTSTSLNATFYLLLTNPVAYQRLMKELEEKRSSGELSDLVTFEQAESCTYLQAVMYEAIRLYPAAGAVLGRDVPAGGMTIMDYYIPAGTVVGTSPWAIHRVPEIWGPDFEEFRPERWLDENASNLKRFFFAFGGGSRTCIGRNISWLEMSKLVPTILMRYNVTLAPDAELIEESG
ncbi:cytochrome P450 family protein [Aspergillus heteromorphus CBS 117.55]|uniref:Cytochrome P450 family protein n=1 Tax=Aspergillus heteromorphus CBS 117.55 TaxID=1448321 RepID=A0A317V8X8_9EURO|nr:cytochrome P450 family protein [Aspergillus heteromorphus CBS 117.55]PWY70505.1 cytochrome P450 family protein [Aspergillus heteromorphus CBS 117.55]